MEQEKMTDELCLKFIKTYDEIMNKTIEHEKKLNNERKRLALRDWATQNAPYRVGDIIESGRTIIEIDRIEGDCYRNELYPVYYGFVLTKALKPRKDEFRTSIFGEKGREIKLIKRSEQ